MSNLIHAKKYMPRIFPIGGTGAPAEIDRAQDITPNADTNRDKIEELGNPNIVGYLKSNEDVSYGLTQLEYGSIEFYQKLANTANLGAIGETGIVLDDFNSAYCDTCAYLTDADDSFFGTFLYPALRLNSFSINIPDPRDVIERNFDLVGERAILWYASNKYYIYQEESIASDDTDYEITLDNTATEDPDNTGEYMFRVVRISSSGTVTELSLSDGDYTETSTTVTIASVSTGDTIKLYYTSSSAPTTLFTPNTSDPVGLRGDSADIYLYIPESGKPSSSDRMVKLQSLTLDVSFDRQDNYEIGNDEVAQRGVNNHTVTANIGRMIEDVTPEEVFRNVSDDYGKIDVGEFSDDVALIVKFYSDKTKNTFKYGIKCTGMTPTSINSSASINEYLDGENVLEGEDLTISADSTVIGV